MTKHSSTPPDGTQRPKVAGCRGVIRVLLMFVQTQQRGCEMRNRKRGSTVTASMSVIRNDEDIDVLVSGYYNPEQNGGWAV